MVTRHLKEFDLDNYGFLFKRIQNTPLPLVKFSLVNCHEVNVLTTAICRHLG